MIIRARRNTNFTIMSNTGLNDERLSLKAKGMLAYLLSKPDNWKVSDRQLATIGPDGRTAVQASLKELEKFGYLKRAKVRNEDGTFAAMSTIYDEPWFDYPTTVNPAQENPAIISTVVTSTVEREREMSSNRIPEPLGLPSIRYRKDKRDADRIAKQRDKMGLNAKELTALTDRVLMRMNASELADSDTDFGDEEFTQAQQTTLALASIGYKTPADVDNLFECWPKEDWRGKKGDAPTYKAIVEYAKVKGIKRAVITPTENMEVQRMEGEDW